MYVTDVGTCLPRLPVHVTDGHKSEVVHPRRRGVGRSADSGPEEVASHLDRCGRGVLTTSLVIPSPLRLGRVRSSGKDRLFQRFRDLTGTSD